MAEFLSERRKAAYEVLDRYPDGKFGRDVAVILDADPATVLKMLAGMKTAGVIESIAEGTSGNSRRVRYYCKHHEAAAKAANAAGRGVTWGTGKTSYFQQKALGLLNGDRQRAAAKRWNDGKLPEPIRTIGPSNHDHRFTVYGPPRPFFSVGMQAEGESAIARAYGGAR